jgi:hypothetical protein
MDEPLDIAPMAEAEYRRTCCEPMEGVSPAPQALAHALFRARAYFCALGAAPEQVRYELAARSEEYLHVYFSCNAMSEFVVIVLDLEGRTARGQFPFHFRDAFGTQADLARVVTTVLRQGAGRGDERAAGA